MAIKVLVVEAPRDIAEGVKQTLRTAGYQVVEATDASFALTMLEYNRPDIIVSRSHLDDMDGCEFCTIVRSDPKTKDIPFVLLAGGDNANVSMATRAGVDVVVRRLAKASDIVGIVQRLT